MTNGVSLAGKSSKKAGKPSGRVTGCRVMGGTAVAAAVVASRKRSSRWGWSAQMNDMRVRVASRPSSTKGDKSTPVRWWMVGGYGRVGGKSPWQVVLNWGGWPSPTSRKWVPAAVNSRKCLCSATKFRPALAPKSSSSTASQWVKERGNNHANPRPVSLVWTMLWFINWRRGSRWARMAARKSWARRPGSSSIGRGGWAAVA